MTPGTVTPGKRTSGGPGAAERIHATGWGVRLLTTLLGLLVGACLGFFVTVAIFVGQARRGIYLFSLDELSGLRWEALPTYLGIAAGAWGGWRGASTLLRGTAFALVGALLLVPVGWFVGSWLWPESSGPWAGATLSAALGILLGLGAGAVWIARAGRARD